MQVAAEKLSPVLLELAIEVEAGKVNEELAKAYSQLGKRAKIRGFRPGKAPRKVLAHLYGPRIQQDVAQRLVDQTYQDAIGQQKVQAVSQPRIEPSEVKDNQPFSYKARVEIVPEIESVNYDGFEVKRPSTKVTEEALNEQLEGLRRANSTLEPPKKKRGAKEGDMLTIDFEVLVDGEVVEGAGAKDFDVELGKNQLLPNIEQAVLEKKSGESATAEVAMGDAHPNLQLRGKTAQFKIEIKDLKERVLPDLDDEFAKDLGDFDGLAALKEELSKDLEKRLIEQADNAVAEALVAKLVEANPIAIPPALVQQQNQLSEQEVLAQARARGQQVRGLPAELRESIQKDSETKVRAGLLMAEIAKKEALKIGDKEIEEGMTELAEQTGKNIAKIRAEYRDPKKREMLVGMILENKVLDIIQSKAKIEQED